MSDLTEPSTSTGAAGVHLTLPPAEATALADLLSETSIYLEFGSGGSTLLALQQGVQHIITVETSAEFLSGVLSNLPDTGAHVYPVLADLGPTGDWGYPVDLSPRTAFASYALAPWATLTQQQLSP
jgi:hypothetical protein